MRMKNQKRHHFSHSGQSDRDSIRSSGKPAGKRVGRLFGDCRKHLGTQAVLENLDACGPQVREMIVLWAETERHDGVGVRPPSQHVDEPLPRLALGGHAVQVHDSHRLAGLR